MLAGLTGACCPNPNISEEFTLTSPQKALLDHKTDLALEHFQKKPFYELLTDENLTSKAITENKNIQRELLQYPSCLELYLGEVKSIPKEKRGFKGLFVYTFTGKDYFYQAIQPIIYEHQTVLLNLYFINEENQLKLYNLSWESEDQHRKEFYECFTPRPQATKK
jgi:hypothetical protein